MEYLKQFRGIIFGYEINLFPDHKNLVYAATLSEYQRVIYWRLVIKYFGPNIQHISRVDNIVADTLSRFPSTLVNNYNTCTSKAQCCANKLFSISRAENNKDWSSLNLLNVQREQQKEMRKVNSKLST